MPPVPEASTHFGTGHTFYGNRADEICDPFQKWIRQLKVLIYAKRCVLFRNVYIFPVLQRDSSCSARYFNILVIRQVLRDITIF